MSFTIFEIPFQSTSQEIRFVPSFNRVLIRALSDQALNFGFKYRVKISEFDFQTLTVGPEIATLKFDPLPDVTQPIEFDIARIVNTEFVYNEILKEQTSVGFTNEITRGIIVNVLETWIDSNTGQIVEGVDTEDVFKIFPGAFTIYQLPHFQPSVFCDEINLKPLTFQKIIRQELTARTNFCFFNPSNIIDKFRIFCQYSNGSSSQTEISPNFGPNDKDVTVLSIIPGNFQSSMFEMLNLFVSVITVSGFELAVSQIKIIHCKKQNSFSLYWLNEFGTFDSMLFEGYSRQTFDVKRETYQKQYFGTGIDFSFGQTEAKFENTRPVYFAQGNEKVKLISNWLEDSELYNLKNLFLSSLIYMKRPSDVDFAFGGFAPDEYIPVKPISTSYEIKQTRSDKNVQVSFDIELAEPFNRQSI